MSTFDSTKRSLPDILTDIVKGKIQLPDFQRGWVWDDDHIRSLLVSIARSFPVGAVMLLETGGDARFQLRSVEGVELPPNAAAELLILDGQQRLTTLTQVLALKTAVKTRTDKGKLAAALIELSLLRQIQIIGSTHSHHILDSLPRVARALVIKESDSHRIVHSPTAMFAMSEMSGQQNKELLVICEDGFAANLINSALSTSTRKRIEIHACGSKTELARNARSHLRLSLRARCLIVWDGDVSSLKCNFREPLTKKMSTRNMPYMLYMCQE